MDPSAPIQVWVIAAPDRIDPLRSQLVSAAEGAAALARAGRIEVLAATGLPASLPPAPEEVDRLVVVEAGGEGSFSIPGVLGWIRLHAAEWPVVMLSSDPPGCTGVDLLADAFDAGAIDVIPLVVLDARVLARIVRWTAATGRLHREERRVRALLQGYLETKSIGVVTIDRHGTIQFANASLEQMFGYERGELAGRGIECLVPPLLRDRHARLRARFWDDPSARPASRLAIEGLRRDGSSIALEVVLSHVNVGSEEWVTALVSDVSERRAMERALTSSEAKLRAIVESGVQGIALLGRDGTVLAVNRNMRILVEQLFGRRVEEGSSLTGLLPPASRDAVAEGLHRASSGSAHVVERELRTTAGESRWFEVVYTPVWGDDGTVSMVSMTALSIEERKRASLALERSEERLSAILRFSWDIIAIIDGEGRVRSASPSVERVLDQREQDLLGTALVDLVHPEDRPLLSSLGRPADSPGELTTPVEARFARRDGSWAELEVVASQQLENPAIGGVIVNLRDVSQRRAAEEALRRSEQKLSASVRNSLLAFIECDRDSRIVGWNPAAERIFGWTREEAIGQPISLLAPDITEPASGKVLEDIERSAVGTHSVTENVTRDGRLITCEWYSSPVVDDEGQIVAVVSLAHDITEKLREQEELRRAKEQAEQATRAKSEFLANMSHEIRTPLNAVVGMTTLLLDTPLDADQRDAAETIRRGSESLLTVINEILDFSKIESGRLEFENRPYDLHRTLEETLAIFRPDTDRRGLALELTIDPRTPRAVLGDETRLRQVLVNLLGNAIKFTEHGGISVIAAPIVNADLPLMHVAVKDTGIGIPRDRRDRLFRSFSQVDASTTRRYGGTGLGLVISKRLVEMMGGLMWVESEEGVGSIFHFTFVSPDAEVPAPPPLPLDGAWFDPAMAERMPLRILLAEDNPVNQRVAGRMLERLGYTIDIVGNGADALDAVGDGAYDVVLMDVQMPRMDGLEATRRIVEAIPVERRPWIVAMTANVMKGDREACLAAGMDDYIGKPVRIEQLVAALQRAGERVGILSR